MFDCLNLELMIFTNSTIAATILLYSILIQCGSRKRSDSRLSGSKRDVLAIGGGVGGAIREQESAGKSENKEKSVQISKIGTPKSKKSKSKMFKSPQQKNAETPIKCRTEGSDGETYGRGHGKKTESKTKHSEMNKGKFGDTINDDTLNDTDCDWGAGEVIYKADRSKKKKRKHG
uniref:Uncharacterized protein n=1 Tax=Panagrolaimus superbus TaxID=310955 RepID=A0A914YKV7_9BILA